LQQILRIMPPSHRRAFLRPWPGKEKKKKKKKTKVQSIEGGRGAEGIERTGKGEVTMKGRGSGKGKS
jgi:hypothetical protein